MTFTLCWPFHFKISFLGWKYIIRFKRNLGDQKHKTEIAAQCLLLILSFSLDRLGCWLTWLFRRWRMMMYNRRTVEDSVCMYLWEELVKQLCVPKTQPEPQQKEGGVLLFFFFLFFPPLCACVLCRSMDSLGSRLPCVFLLRRTLARERDRERAPAGRF